jgi:hypothetical protein
MDDKLNPNRKKGFFAKIFGWLNLFINCIHITYVYYQIIQLYFCQILPIVLFLSYITSDKLFIRL